MAELEKYHFARQEFLMGAFERNLDRRFRGISFLSGNKQKNWFAHPFIEKVKVGRLAIVGYSNNVPVFSDDVQ